VSNWFKKATRRREISDRNGKLQRDLGRQLWREQQLRASNRWQGALCQGESREPNMFFIHRLNRAIGILLSEQKRRILSE
jgi:hypothetical protein